MKPLSDLFDLIQRIKTPAPWIFAIFIATYLDWYALSLTKYSLSDFLVTPALMQKWAANQWLLQAAICVTFLSLIWFVILPIMIAFVDWFTIECIYRFPAFLRNEESYPSHSKGFVPIQRARRHAILRQNKLLLEQCDIQLERLHERHMLRRCCFGILIFSIAAWMLSTPEHLSLLDHLQTWLEQAAKWKQFIFCIIAIVSITFASQMLFNPLSLSDDYIYFPELVQEFEH